MDVRSSLCTFMICMLAASQATRYNLKVRTSRHFGAGTGENIRITLFGSLGTVSSPIYEGWGLDRLEAGQVDEINFDGKDIGSIVQVQAEILQDGDYFDKWRLFWIKVSADGDRYKAIFEYSFKFDGAKSKARRLEIEQCRNGFSQGHYSGQSTCLDRDECKNTCNGYGQKCTNLPGTFKCECQPGYIPDDSICRDYDECSEAHRNPCEFPHAQCINSPGSYECKCKQGYEGAYHSCQDTDECKLNQHDCSQNCINTPGSYKCGCKPGFKLAVDGKTCLDVDECKGPNICNATTSVCYDEYGTHRCVCKVGYKESSIVKSIYKNTCVPIECTPLKNLDANVILSPPRCQSGKNFFNDECKVECKPGYELDQASAQKLKCLNSGFVSVHGNMPKCRPKKCGKISAPAFGYTLPQSCSSSGIEQGRDCHIYCDEGFILAGDRKYHCNLQKYDKDPSKAICTRVPKISCPKDVHVSLPADKDRVALDNNFPDYKTDFRMEEVISNIPDVGPSYEFPRGYTTIIYTVKNELNQTDSCSFQVSVKDLTPPKVEFCPSSFSVVSVMGRPVNVTWEEPRFKDNVKLNRVLARVKNGVNRSPTPFQVSYSAYDSSGNAAQCMFGVDFNILRCDFNSIPGGDQFTVKTCFPTGGSSLCIGQCLPSKTFDIINSQQPVKYMWRCRDAKFRVERMPDCVDFIQKKSKDAKCPVGYKETQNYRTLQAVCGKCPRGTFYKNGDCVDCHKNTYQHQEGSLTCKECPAGYGTISTRSRFVSDCKQFCYLGYISSTGLTSAKGGCKLCPKNTYSEMTGATSCKKCPNGTSTNGIGHTRIQDCLFATRNVTMLPNGPIEVSVGDAINIDCFAEGNPLPFVHIRRQKGGANPKTHSFVPVPAPNSYTRRLRYSISHVTIYDAGAYTCLAENSRGAVYKQVKLVVTEQGSGAGPAF